MKGDNTIEFLLLFIFFQKKINLNIKRLLSNI